ncbi:DUF6233 domain-containing protein [Streptomyces sp. NPDC058691]|uniref:DUF6233 domain-containing protein n=1 Tax=Streptomyces sp. NPDC058691 TaxID=3346601 RepID=UPI00364EF4E6
MKSRLHEADGSWWYELEIRLPSITDVRGHLTDEPTSVVFLAPAGPSPTRTTTRCPTIQHQIAPDWKIEEPTHFTGNVGPARIVHRSNCRAIRDIFKPATTEQARAALQRTDATPCTACRPDLVLLPRP